MVSAPVETRIRSAAQGALALLAAALPFEATDPLAPLGPLQLSSVELFLYAALALWAASLVARPARRSERTGWPAAYFAVVVWATVLVLSAARAPVERAAAIKFTLRSLGGVALFFAAADLLRAPAAARRAALALSAGALMAAGLACAEALWPDRMTLLRPFHEKPFQVFGLVRASGPFQYPNIAAMYLEAAAPVVLLSVSGRTAWRVAATLLLLAAVLLTASRAGLVASALVLVGIAVVSRPARATALATLGGLGMLALVVLAAGPAMAVRQRFWNDDGWYRASITPGVPGALSAGDLGSATVEVHNLGALRWPHDGAWPVAISYHWIDPDSGRAAVFEGERTHLPRDLAPGDSEIVQAVVRAPDYGGHYELWWDLVHEHVTWFSERGAQGARIEVTVSGPAAPPGTWQDDPTAPSPTRPALEAIPRRTLWRAGLKAWREHLLLGVGPDNFRHVLGSAARIADADERLHANSFYVETLTDLGLAGMLALAALGVTLARAARRAVARPATGLLALGFAAGFGAFLLHGLLDYFLEFTPTYGLYWLLAGGVVALARPTEDAPRATEEVA